jgi:SAM-dependent methyltransferase
LAAVDLTINSFDGLGAHSNYDVPFTPIQAEFDHLPLAPNQADVVIFNASFHYSPDYELTIREACRVLRHNGRLIICDTPVYHNRQSGEQMVAERERHFDQMVGFPANALPSQNFLTYQSLTALGRVTDSHWQLLWPSAQWRWLSRRLRAALRRQREPAQFPLLVGQQSPDKKLR